MPGFIGKRGARRAGSEVPQAARIRGVNLSGWLIVEPWVTPSLFAATGASNEAELERVLGWDEYADRVIKHYNSFITEDDFRRIALAGFNSVRLPVPWHVFDTEGAALRHPVCVSCVDHALDWAEKHGLTVLLDLGTVPGGQGDSNASPTTPASMAEWHSSTNGRHVALHVLDELASRYGERPGLAGIELLDSPVMRRRRGLTVTEGIPGHYLRNFYRDAYEVVRLHMPSSKAVVVSASGQPEAWRGFMRGPRYQNVWIDLHLYHYRGEFAQDISTPAGLSAAIARNKRAVREARETGMSVLVGEWSAAAVLPDSVMTPEGRIAYERVFTSSQLASFDAADGWYFQTWKTERRIPAWDARAALASFERGMME